MSKLKLRGETRSVIHKIVKILKPDTHTKRCDNGLLPVADLGGGGTPGPCPPPLLRPFSTIAPPPLFVHVPPPPFSVLNLKKKKNINVFGTQKCVGFPPPPPFGLARLSTLVALRKKVSESPPPRLLAFLGLARLSRLPSVRGKKKTVLCPPPLFLNPESAPVIASDPIIDHMYRERMHYHRLPLGNHKCH